MPEDIHSLAAPYALYALDDLERRRFEAHLAECDACTREVAEFSELAGELVEVEVQPSAGLRAATLDLIASTPQESPTPQDKGPSRATSGSRSDEGPVGGSAGGSSAAGGVGPGRSGPSPWILGAAAAIVLVVAAGALVLSLGGDDTNGQVETVLEAPDATRFVMTSDEPARAGTDLEVVHSATHDATVVVGDHVHSAPEGETYQLWGVTEEGGMLDAGVFEPDAEGIVEVPVGTPQGVAGWAVTVEPEGGSPEPTGDPVFESGAV